MKILSQGSIGEKSECHLSSPCTEAMHSKPSEEGYGCPLSQPLSCPCSHTAQTLWLCVPIPSLAKSHRCVRLSDDLQIQVSWCADVASLWPEHCSLCKGDHGQGQTGGWYLCHQVYTSHRFPHKLPKKKAHSPRWALFFCPDTAKCSLLQRMALFLPYQYS